MTGAGDGRVKVRDIAAEAGVSIATVSRVLNDNVNVAPHTRELVLQAVARRRAHQEPVPAPAGAVYVRCPYRLTDYFGVIVSSVAETLELHGRQLILNAGEAAQRLSVLPGLPDKPGIDAAIIILPRETDEELAKLRARGFAFVVIDPRTPLPRHIAAVSAAHFAGALSVTAHLVGLGHRRVGVIGGPAGWLATEARLAGHHAALARAGELASRELLLNAEATVEDGYRAAGTLLDLPDRPTALVGFNDKVAVGALRAADDRGLRVPQDLSVTGFDDLDLSRATRPTLTTVRQPLQEMGRLAVTLLMRIIAGHDLEALHVELATDLIVRGSTGPVPTA
jgi:LacI family transcriptional regulator